MRFRGLRLAAVAATGAGAVSDSEEGKRDRDSRSKYNWECFVVGVHAELKFAAGSWIGADRRNEVKMKRLCNCVILLLRNKVHLSVQ